MKEELLSEKKKSTDMELLLQAQDQNIKKLQHDIHSLEDENKGLKRDISNLQQELQESQKAVEQATVPLKTETEIEKY